MPKRKNRKRNKYLDYLAYLALRCFTALLYIFPLRANYATARFIGDMLYRFDKKHRHRAEEHLRRSFPDWEESRIKKTARESMRNMVYLGLEFLYTVRLLRPATWNRHIKLLNMSQTLKLLLKRESGIIFLTGHFGNWEVVGYTMAALGFPNNAVARSLDNPYINNFVLGERSRRGMNILDKKGATEQIPGIIADKGCVSFIADQDAGKKGVFVDFFGRKASTYKSIALLAMQNEIPVIVGYGTRLDGYFHFEIGIEDIIYPSDWKDAAKPLEYITQRYTTALENVIRRAPEQYLWTHRRWKHRPKGEDQPEDGIA